MKVNVTRTIHSDLPVAACLKIVSDAIEPCRSFRICRSADLGGAPFAGVLAGNVFWLRFNRTFNNFPYWRLVGTIAPRGSGTLVRLKMSPPILLWCVFPAVPAVLILGNLGNANPLRAYVIALVVCISWILWIARGGRQLAKSLETIIRKSERTGEPVLPADQPGGGGKI